MSTSSTSAISGLTGTSAAEIQSNYMTLLITQLQNQNPLNPMDNSQMASQLAQMSQLQLTESMDTKFGQTLLAARVNEGMSMIGKQVTYFPDGATSSVTAKVDGVDVVDSDVQLRVGNQHVSLDHVTSVTS